MFGWIDGYFKWLNRGGFARLAYGLLLPMFVVAAVGVSAIVGGSSTADSSTERSARAATPRPPAARTATPRPTAIRTATPESYKLALVSARCEINSGFRECEGYVKNISGGNIETLQVVIHWYDASGTPQSSDSALVDYDPLLPGQESPWSTIGRHNPELTRFTVEFKEFLGGTIRARDDRP